MEENNEIKTEEIEKSFDELLKNPKYQAEFDRKMESARVKWETKWQEKAEAEKTEAERLAKLSETEKFEEQIKKLQAKNDELIASQNASALKDEAIKIAAEKGVDVKFLDLFDFTRESAETIKEKLSFLKDNMDTAVTHKVNDRLNQTPPKQVSTEGLSKEKAYLDQKYSRNPYYKK